MIHVSKLEKHYGRKKVLNGQDLDFPDRGLVVLQGPSGCGKSTLLNILCGIEKADSGTIKYDEKTWNPAKDDMTDFRRQKIGIIFQDNLIENDRTVEENVTDAMAIFQSQDVDVHALLKYLGLGRMRKRLAKSLSAGERQRLGIARAMSKKSAYLFADEPTGNLDSVNANRIFRLLKSLSKTRLVLIATHDRKLSEKYADFIFEYEDGAFKRKENTPIEEPNIETPLKTEEESKTPEKIKTRDRKGFFPAITAVLSFFLALCLGFLLPVGEVYKEKRIDAHFCETYHQKDSMIFAPVGGSAALIPTGQEYLIDSREESGIYDLGNLIFSFGPDCQFVSLSGDIPLKTDSSLSFRMIDIDMPIQSTFGECYDFSTVGPKECLVSDRFLRFAKGLYPNIGEDRLSEYVFRIRNPYGELEDYTIKDVVPIANQNLVFFHHGGNYYDLFNLYDHNSQDYPLFEKQFGRLFADCSIRIGEELAVSTGLLNQVEEDEREDFLDYFNLVFERILFGDAALKATRLAVVGDTEPYFMIPSSDTELGRDQAIIFLSRLIFSASVSVPSYLEDYEDKGRVTYLESPIPFSRNPERPYPRISQVLLRKDIYDGLKNGTFIPDTTLEDFKNQALSAGSTAGACDIDIIGYIEGDVPFVLFEGKWYEHMQIADILEIQYHTASDANSNPLLPILEDGNKAKKWLEDTEASVTLVTAEEYVRTAEPDALSIDFYLILFFAIGLSLALLLLLWQSIVFFLERRQVGIELCLGQSKKKIVLRVVKKAFPTVFLVFDIVFALLSIPLGLSFLPSLYLLMPGIVLLASALLALIVLLFYLLPSPRKLL